MKCDSGYDHLITWAISKQIGSHSFVVGIHSLRHFSSVGIVSITKSGHFSFTVDSEHGIDAWPGGACVFVHYSTWNSAFSAIQLANLSRSRV